MTGGGAPRRRGYFRGKGRAGRPSAKKGLSGKRLASMALGAVVEIVSRGYCIVDDTQ